MTAAFHAIVHDVASSPDDVYEATATLLASDPVLGVAAVFELLATEPRLKPSRALLIDPGDAVRRRWDSRVAATAALLDSPQAARVADEVGDELGHDPVFAADVERRRRVVEGRPGAESGRPLAPGRPGRLR